MIGPMTGGNQTPVPSVRPLFLNPATTANKRGPKSRAGLMAYPFIPPNEIPMATTSSPMTMGAKFAPGSALSLSTTAKIRPTRQSGTDDLVKKAWPKSWDRWKS